MIVSSLFLIGTLLASSQAVGGSDAPSPKTTDQTTTSTDGGASSSSSSKQKTPTHILLGRGLCLDSSSNGYDAISLGKSNFPTHTDCEQACLAYIFHENYRGYEHGPFCYCLFDHGIDNGSGGGVFIEGREVKNYGLGKGEVKGVSGEEGSAYCYKFVGVERLGRTEWLEGAEEAKKATVVVGRGATDENDDEYYYYDDEIDLIEETKNLPNLPVRSVVPPSQQPSTNQEKSDTSTTNQQHTEQGGATSEQQQQQQQDHYHTTYNSLFSPHQSQYDMLKFDPYSFTGAPLGGWGRDTRNRLASLPIRLVGDFGGGWDNGGGSLLGSTVGGEGKEDGAVQEMDVNADGTTQSVSSDTNGSVAQAKHAPHFIIHDGTGQRYICRIYTEEELVVTSRMDSVFQPALTVVENGGSPDTDDANALARLKDVIEEDWKGKNTFEIKLGDSAKTKVEIKVVGDLKRVSGGEEDGDDDETSPFQIINGGDGPLPAAIQQEVVNLLNNMGLGNAAEELAVQLEGALQGAAGGAVAENGQDINAIMAQIGMAAAVGAGVEGATEVAATTTRQKTSQYPTQLTQGEIVAALEKLNGICSQIHLGWWSYEWCHNEHVRQFHVGIKEGGKNGGSYEVEDVTMVGHFGGVTEVIYPRGVYNGGEMQGTTTTIAHDRTGKVLTTTVRVHTPEEDEKYSHAHHDHDVLHEKYKKDLKKSLGHGVSVALSNNWYIFVKGFVAYSSCFSLCRVPLSNKLLIMEICATRLDLRVKFRLSLGAAQKPRLGSGYKQRNEGVGLTETGSKTTKTILLLGLC